MSGIRQTRWTTGGGTRRRVHSWGHGVARNWSRILLSVLGVCELLLAVGARPVLTTVVGIVGGLALAGVPWVLSHSRVGAVLLLIGAVPFAVLTWWTLVTPLLAVLALGIGIALLRRPSTNAAVSGAAAGAARSARPTRAAGAGGR